MKKAVTKFRPGRMLKVARALRESRNPKKFDMSRYGYSCRTPACAFGHYAHRGDLQKLFKLDRSGIPVLAEKTEWGDYYYVDWDDAEVLGHFGISLEDSHELFSDQGCDGARTANEAAAYIENFVRRKLAGKR